MHKLNDKTDYKTQLDKGIYYFNSVKHPKEVDAEREIYSINKLDKDQDACISSWKQSSDSEPWNDYKSKTGFNSKIFYQIKQRKGGRKSSRRNRKSKRVKKTSRRNRSLKRR